MFSFLGFILVVVLFFWIVSLSSRVSDLEKKFKAGFGLAAKPEALAPTMPEAKPKSLLDGGFTPSVSAAPEKVLEKTVPVSEAETAAGWLTKIGVLALIFGIGFFIKYAIDQGWLSQWTRVILGVVSGGLLCVLGSLWKDKYPKYSSALAGGGVALMYFSGFAAYQFYHLLPQAVALVALVVFSGVGVYMAYGRKSLGLGALAVCGAYLAPLLLNSGTDQHVALFIYLGLLSLVAVIISFDFYSNELLTFAFLGSAFDFIIWAFNYSNNANTFAASFFVAATFLLLLIGTAISFSRHAKNNSLPEQAEKYFGLLTVLLGLFFSSSILFLLYRNFHDYLSIMGLLGSVGAFLAYAIVDRLERKGVNYCLAFVGTGLLALACIWQFSGKTTDFLLIALGLALVLGGMLLKRAELRVWGLLTLIACVFAVLFEPYDTANYVFILNSKFGLVLAETFSLWFTGWLYSQIQPTETEAMASEAAHAIGSMLLWFGFSWELVEYYRNFDVINTRNLMLSLWWIAYGTVLMVFGGLSKSAVYKKIALAIYILAILKVFLYDVLNLETGYRIVSFIVLGAILLIVSYFYQKNREKISQFLT